MLTQSKNHRKGGSFSLANFSEQNAENSTLLDNNTSLRACAGPREIGNSAESSVNSGSSQDWKIGRLDFSVESPTQANSTSTYKPQISPPEAKNAVNPDGELAVWPVILQALSASVSTPVFTTWIQSCQFESLTGNVLTLAVDSEFSQGIIAKRYRANIEAAAELVLGEPIRLRLLVDSTLASPVNPQGAEVTQDSAEPNRAQTALAINPEYPLARFQNPTNNPQVAQLLEKYGDMRGVFKNHPFFKRIQRPVEEGGWGTDLGGLISLGKKYTLERVLWAARQANEYQGIHTSRGATFNHIVRKGLEGVK